MFPKLLETLRRDIKQKDGHKVWLTEPVSSCSTPEVANARIVPQGISGCYNQYFLTLILIRVALNKDQMFKSFLSVNYYTF